MRDLCPAALPVLSAEAAAALDGGEIASFVLCATEVLIVRTDGCGRAAEAAAVGRLVKHRFGVDAAVGHYPSGAPYVEGREEVRISITHGAGYAALALAAGVVGVDIEAPREQLFKVASRFLTEAERSLLTDVKALQWAWTVKEAVYKAALTAGLPLMSIHIAGCCEAEVTDCDGSVAYRVESISVGSAILTVARPKS